MSHTATINIRLTFFERSFLVMLSQRGGETRFNHNLVAPHVTKALGEMCDKGVVARVPIPGLERECYYRLTDTGRMLADYIKQGVPSTPKTGG